MIRESMIMLPAPVQPFITWLTAKPIAQQLNTYKTRSTMFHIYTSAALLVLGTGLGAVGYSMEIPPIWILGFIIATSGVKQLQVMICHNCAHDMVFDKSNHNYMLGHFISILLLIKPFDLYKHEHNLHHDPKTLLTDDDDTLSFLKGTVGIRTSDTIAIMWLKLIYTALSPIKLVRSIWGRAYLIMSSKNTFAAGITFTYVTTLLYGAYVFGVVDIIFAAWFLPILVGYHISTTFRLAAEHTWPSVETLNNRGIDFICEATTGVFIGEKLDHNQSNNLIVRLFKISSWAIKMLTIHLFVRLFIMVGDTPCHDFHHRRPKSKEWTNYITARENDKLTGSKPFPSNYIDQWGYANTVSSNFRSYQSAASYYDQTTDYLPA